MEQMTEKQMLDTIDLCFDNTIKRAIEEVGFKTYMRMCFANKRILNFSDIYDILRGD